MSVRLLDAELLEEFGELLMAKGVRVDRLNPGLTDTEIDEIIAPADLELPEEVRAWWRWHNDGSYSILPSRDLRDLRYEIESYIDRVETEREVGVPLYPERSLQPVGDQPIIFVQCLGAGTSAAPIHVMGSWSGDHRLVLPSFGELVLTWMRYIEEGIYSFRSTGGWADAQRNLPAANLGVQ